MIRLTWYTEIKAAAPSGSSKGDAAAATAAVGQPHGDGLAAHLLGRRRQAQRPAGAQAGAPHRALQRQAAERPGGEGSAEARLPLQEGLLEPWAAGGRPAREGQQPLEGGAVKAQLEDTREAAVQELVPWRRCILGLPQVVWKTFRV